MPVDDTSFPGEFVDSYELGAKTTWMDGNLLLNGTLFHQEYTDFQLNSFLGTSFVVRSIPEVISQGRRKPKSCGRPASKGLMLQGGVTYADTELRRPDAVCGPDARTAALLNCPATTSASRRCGRRRRR